MCKKFMCYGYYIHASLFPFYGYPSAQIGLRITENHVGPLMCVCGGKKFNCGLDEVCIVEYIFLCIMTK